MSGMGRFYARLKSGVRTSRPHAAQTGVSVPHKPASVAQTLLSVHGTPARVREPAPHVGPRRWRQMWGGFSNPPSTSGRDVRSPLPSDAVVLAVIARCAPERSVRTIEHDRV